MLTGFTKYLVLSLLASFSAMSTYSGIQHIQILNLKDSNERLGVSLQTCSARIENIREDMESDETVSDPSLFIVPDNWMLPTRTSD